MTVSAFHQPGLTRQAWHDPASFAFTRRLERNAPAILNELRPRLPEVLAEAHPMGDELAEGAWDALFLYAVGEKKPACQNFPTTTRVVESIPGATRAGLVYFSVLRPSAHVKPHHGPTNTRIRCHLGLITPPGAWLRVGRERRAWQAGKCLMFDDSVVHESKNSSREPRVVLIVDVWHPELTRSDRARLYRLFRADTERRRSEHSQAGSLARVGAFRAFVDVDS